jgi:two-component sensor histidine kinase
MSIARKFTIYTFFLVFLLSAVFTPIKIISSYRRETRRISGEIHQIEQSHLPFLVTSLWLTNYQLLQQQVNSIAEFPYIDRVEVIDDEGTVFIGSAVPNSEDTASNLITHREVLTYRYKEEQLNLGSMTLYINVSRLKADVLANEISFLLFQFISAVLIAAAISVLFHALVGRHLHGFTEFLKNDDSSSLSTPFSFSRKRSGNDELEYLSRAVNIMREKLHNQFHEKELMLREVHHRIKNNMASIEGLLRLQAAEIDNPEVSRVLLDAKNRLHSMHFLYEKLYQQGPGNAMAAEDFLGPLTREIIRINTANQSVDLTTEFDTLILDPKLLSTIGIIVNELLTNSLKHAFGEGNSGSITVTLTQSTGTTILLLYRDNGIGIPEAVIAGNSSGLGMMLVRSLTDQLRGSLEIRQSGGTEFRFLIPCSPSVHPA